MSDGRGPLYLSEESDDAYAPVEAKKGTPLRRQPRRRASSVKFNFDSENEEETKGDHGESNGNVTYGNSRSGTDSFNSNTKDEKQMVSSLDDDDSDVIMVATPKVETKVETKVELNKVGEPSFRCESMDNEREEDLATGDDPEWVRDFGDNRADDERRKALTSLYDDDDDSVMDLLSDKGEGDSPFRGEGGDTSVKDGGKIEKGDDGKGDGAKRTGKKGNSGSALRMGASGGIRDSLPLTVAPKLDEGIVLVQGEDEGLDMSGDVGAVGRVKVAADGTLYLDLKGGLYRAHTYATNTMAVVTVGEDEARVTAVLDEAVALECERDLFASGEVVVQGSVEGDGFEAPLDGGVTEEGDDVFAAAEGIGGSGERVEGTNRDASKAAPRGKAGTGAVGRGRGRGGARGGGGVRGAGRGTRGGRGAGRGGSGRRDGGGPVTSRKKIAKKA